MKTKSEIGAIILCCGLAVTTGILIAAALSGKQDRQRQQDLENAANIPAVLDTSKRPEIAVHNGDVARSNAQLSPSLAAAATARTQSELSAAAAVGAEEAKAAAMEGSTGVNQYGVSKAKVAAARAESLKWMTEHCDPQRNVCR